MTMTKSTTCSTIRCYSISPWSTFFYYILCFILGHMCFILVPWYIHINIKTYRRVISIMIISGLVTILKHVTKLCGKNRQGINYSMFGCWKKQRKGFGIVSPGPFWVTSHHSPPHTLAFSCFNGSHCRRKKGPGL